MSMFTRGSSIDLGLNRAVESLLRSGDSEGILPIVQVGEPVLTSVDNKPEQVALLCVQLLESSIERSEAYSSVVLQPELAQGETS